MSYVILNPKSRREESLIRQFAEKMKLDLKRISLEEYINQIAESRREIKAGKKVSLKDLENGI